jgi:hypothetical protein
MAPPIENTTEYKKLIIIPYRTLEI